MKTTHTATRTSHQRMAQRGAMFGFAMGIACMAALFVHGLLIGSAGLVVVASSTAAGLGGAWAAVASTFARQLKQVRR